MQKWEYCYHVLDSKEYFLCTLEGEPKVSMDSKWRQSSGDVSAILIAALGTERWEVFSIVVSGTNQCMWFKRPIQENNAG